MLPKARKEESMSGIWNLIPRMRSLLSNIPTLAAAGALALGANALPAQQSAVFGPSNPFFAPSPLPFHAPPFDKIKDTDYQPAIEAGIAQQIAEDPGHRRQSRAAHLRKHARGSGKERPASSAASMSAFNGVTGANTNPTLQKVQNDEAPEAGRACRTRSSSTPSSSSASQAIYKQRERSNLDAESQRLLEIDYERFVHAGANLSDADKASSRSSTRKRPRSPPHSHQAARRHQGGAFVTADKAALAGLSDARDRRRRRRPPETARSQGYVLPLQNTTQQPVLQSLTDRATRQALFENSWNRAERGDANDTRATIARLAQLRAQKAKLLGYPNYAAWKLDRPDGQDARGRHQVHGRAGPGRHRQGRAAKPKTSRPSSTRRRAASRSSPGTGTSTPSRFARPNTISTKTRSNPTSS